MVTETITQQIGNVVFKVFVKELNMTWRRHANQLRTRIEWVHETNSESSMTTEQPATASETITPLPRRSTRIRKPRISWSPSN